MKSVMQHSFSQVPRAEIQRSTFDRSHGYKTTFDAGWLVPFYVDEALPADTFTAKVSAFARLSTPIKPVMDNMVMDFFFFAVPVRLIWTNFQKFCGEQTDPGDATDYVVPTMTAPAVTGHVVGSLSDYFGIPTGVASLSHSSLWHRAYNLIWNEWFRDQNLQDSVVVDKDDGPDTSTDYALLRRGKRHDYFTSCLPWPQKADAGVSIPLGTTAPVIGIGVSAPSTTQNIPFLETGATGGYFHPATNGWKIEEADDGPGAGEAHLFVEQNTVDAGYPGIYADLANATAYTINVLRQAFQVQKMYERDARGGTRYTEILRSHFGVVSPDARLQRPEYLGGGSCPVNVNPIAQTGSTDATTPQGNLAAMGTAAVDGIGFTKSFTEHCVLIGLVNVRADLTYQQGLNRMFSRSTRFDFYWPALAHIGEQAVLNKEIYAQGTAADANVFGYQERYAEYRYKPSQITGQFRSTYAQTLDLWHLSQEFTALPVLNASFIVDNPPIDRVVATPDEPHFLFDSFIRLKCARPMPVFGVPGLIDHF